MHRVSGRGRVAAAGLCVALLFVVAGAAIGATTTPAIQTSTPRSANQITNLDVLRQQIRNYYGDPLGTGIIGADSAYVEEVHAVEARAALWLRLNAIGNRPKLAIVLDIDDTSLTTWNYEIASNWDFSPVTSTEFGVDQKFPPVPGMVALVQAARNEGYAIFWITGRPATVEAASLGNLTHDGIGIDAGYPVPSTLSDGEDGLYTKPAVADYPVYLQQACAAELAQTLACTTIHYKSATRAHIESLGYDIVASFGDQYSDLSGGHADLTFKMPNPNYFLP